MTMCHVWPGITPFNVWHLSYYMWFRFASATDAWVEAHNSTPPTKPAGRRR